MCRCLRMNRGVSFGRSSFAGMVDQLFRTFDLPAAVPRRHAWSKRSQEAIAEVSQQAQEDFAGVRVVQQFDRVPREVAALAPRRERRRERAARRRRRLVVVLVVVVVSVVFFVFESS